MSKETGGPAFPCVSEHREAPSKNGMTLRDYFAAHCPNEEIDARMPGTVGGLAELLKEKGIIGAWTDIIRAYDQKDVARLRVAFRWEYADSMLAERNKQ